MGSESYHEPYDLLSAGSRELHRAFTSLIEELQAIDWYQQRADVCDDPALKAVLLHNRGEEVEHAMMVLEWLRRNDREFGATARTYLFSDKPITEIEAAGQGAAGDGALAVGSLKREARP